MFFTRARIPSVGQVRLILTRFTGVEGEPELQRARCPPVGETIAPIETRMSLLQGHHCQNAATEKAVLTQSASLGI